MWRKALLRRGLPARSVEWSGIGLGLAWEGQCVVSVICWVASEVGAEKAIETAGPSAPIATATCGRDDKFIWTPPLHGAEPALSPSASLRVNCVEGGRDDNLFTLSSDGFDFEEK